MILIITHSGASDEWNRVCLSMTAYTQLQDELSFIHDHNEHADMATGTDFGLNGGCCSCGQGGDRIIWGSNQVSYPPTPPDCYQQGDSFHWTKHAVFILHDAALKGLQPDHLCARDIFVWLPPFLPGAPNYFKCTCGGHLTKNGMMHVLTCLW